MRILKLNSYAKLNLYLKVLDKRQDKFHNIKTIFERIDLSDKIILKERPDGKINILCNDPLVPKDSRNLCYRAARLLRRAFHMPRGLDIRIIKRIPVAAGLAGGSSNAAAVLLGLNKLWRLNLSVAEIAKLAGAIGSDVPFFIYNTPFAYASGRGERIRLLKVPKSVCLWHILVVPNLEVSTPFIYKKWDARIKHSEKKERAGLTGAKSDVKILISGLRKNDLSSIRGCLFNSLQEVTLSLYPGVARIREQLAATIGQQSILISGSGPAVFGVVSSRKEASSLSRRLKRQDRSLRVFVAKTH